MPQADLVPGAGFAVRDRLALSRAEAAAVLGISVDSFERYVQPEIRLVRRGRMRIVPVAELERWLSENQALTLDGPVGAG